MPLQAAARLASLSALAAVGAAPPTDLWTDFPPSCHHILPVRSDWVLAIDADFENRVALSACVDGTMRLWNLSTEQPEVIMRPQTAYAINAVSLHWSSRRALSASDDKSVRLWNAETGETIWKTESHEDWVYSVSADWEADRAATGSWDNTIKIWDISAGECIMTLWGHSGDVRAVSLNWRFQRVLSGSSDKTLRLWGLMTREELLRLNGHTDIVSSVVMDWPSMRALSGSFDKTLILWDLENGLSILQLRGHSGRVTDVSMDWSSRRAVSTSLDGTLRFWNLDTGKCIRTLQGAGEQFAVAWSWNTGAVLSGSNSHVELWDLHCMMAGVLFEPNGPNTSCGQGDFLASYQDCYEAVSKAVVAGIAEDNSSIASGYATLLEEDNPHQPLGCYVAQQPLGFRYNRGSRWDTASNASVPICSHGTSPYCAVTGQAGLQERASEGEVLLLGEAVPGPSTGPGGAFDDASGQVRGDFVCILVPVPPRLYVYVLALSFVVVLAALLLFACLCGRSAGRLAPSFWSQSRRNSRDVEGAAGQTPLGVQILAAKHDGRISPRKALLYVPIVVANLVMPSTLLWTTGLNSNTGYLALGSCAVALLPPCRPRTPCDLLLPKAEGLRSRRAWIYTLRPALLLLVWYREMQGQLLTGDFVDDPQHWSRAGVLRLAQLRAAALDGEFVALRITWIVALCSVAVAGLASLIRMTVHTSPQSYTPLLEQNLAEAVNRAMKEKASNRTHLKVDLGDGKPVLVRLLKETELRGSVNFMVVLICFDFIVALLQARGRAVGCACATLALVFGCLLGRGDSWWQLSRKIRASTQNGYEEDPILELRKLHVEVEGVLSVILCSYALPWVALDGLSLCVAVLSIILSVLCLADRLVERDAGL